VDKQKQEELSLKKFQSLCPYYQGGIIRGESPDFRIQTADARMVGIELTKLLPDRRESGGSAHRQFDVRSRHLTKMAEAAARAHARWEFLQRLDVSLYRAGLASPRPAEEKRFIEELLDLALSEASPPEANGVSSTFQREFPRHPLLAKYLKWIEFFCRPGAGLHIGWATFHLESWLDFGRSDIERIVEAKSEKARRYRDHHDSVSEFVLLVVSGSDVGIAAPPLHLVSDRILPVSGDNQPLLASAGFDTIFLLLYAADQLYRLFPCPGVIAGPA
jgi:hypothetical protein